MTENTMKLGLTETVEIMDIVYISIAKDVPFGALNFLVNTGHILEDETMTDNEKFTAVKEIFLQDQKTLTDSHYPYRHIRQATRVLIQALKNTNELDLELPESTMEIFTAAM